MLLKIISFVYFFIITQQSFAQEDIKVDTKGKIQKVKLTEFTISEENDNTKIKSEFCKQKNPDKPETCRAILLENAKGLDKDGNTVNLGQILLQYSISQLTRELKAAIGRYEASFLAPYITEILDLAIRPNDKIVAGYESATLSDLEFVTVPVGEITDDFTGTVQIGKLSATVKATPELIKSLQENSLKEMKQFTAYLGDGIDISKYLVAGENFSEVEKESEKHPGLQQFSCVLLTESIQVNETIKAGTEIYIHGIRDPKTGKLIIKGNLNTFMRCMDGQYDDYEANTPPGYISTDYIYETRLNYCLSLDNRPATQEYKELEYKYGVSLQDEDFGYQIVVSSPKDYDNFILFLDPRRHMPFVFKHISDSIDPDDLNSSGYFRRVTNVEVPDMRCVYTPDSEDDIRYKKWE